MTDATHQNTYDLIVIGAGINGAGIFREAALRGLRVLLLEKDDLGNATTATSSRLIHGGLRYLEHYEFALVRESLRERERLLHAAPHLVTPLPLTLPIYDGHSRGPAMITLGMIAYDALSFDKSVPQCEMLTRDEALEREPGLEPDGLKAAARYYDAQVNFPERIVVENMIDGAEHGGEFKTYAPVVGFVLEAGVVRGVRYMQNGAEHTAYAQVTMNVAGPWVDDVLGLAAELPRYNGGTKGSHIVVEPFPGAPKDALYIEARQDGRPYFIIPWNHLYLIGTTDIRFDGDRDNIVASEEEIAYLLKETNLAIPDAHLDRDDVLYTFSGVRPLPYKPEGSTGAITRKHIIKRHQPQVGALFTIIGGKLTTYRSLAEEAVDAVEKEMGRRRTKSETRNRPLPGGAENYGAAVRDFMDRRPRWLSQDAAEWLISVYGLRAQQIVDLATDNERYQQPIREGHPAIVAVIPFSFEQERALNLRDVLLRRTMLALEADAGIDVSFSAAFVAQEIYDWDDVYRDAQLAQFNEENAKRLPRHAHERVGI